MWTQSPKFPRIYWYIAKVKHCATVKWYLTSGVKIKRMTPVYMCKKLVKNNKSRQGYVTSSAFKLDLIARHINIMPIEDLISSASFHTSSDNCERNTQKRNSNDKDCKKETIGTLMWLYWGDLVKLAWWGRLFCNDALQNFYSLRPTKSNKQALHV